jgi:hypothetical protein
LSYAGLACEDSSHRSHDEVDLFRAFLTWLKIEKQDGYVVHYGPYPVLLNV